MTIKAMNSALDFLRDKYGVGPGVIAEGPECFQLHLPDGNKADLLPHRVERRFVELKKIIDGKTLEGISTFRFAAFRAHGDLRKMLAAELDLAAFLSGSDVVRLFAAGDGQRVCNVIFRLANGVSGCIECSSGLPATAPVLDRHEIIARRGVASDRVVDTQVPQHSIYVWNEDGTATYTDVDTELFGLSDEAIWTVRAAFAVLSQPSLAACWNQAAQASLRQAEAALDCALSGTPVTF
ncbi:MAG: hypothetical protein ACOX9E_05205 [Lentisphaeria bacterium]|jgi:hypothetical protein